MDRRGTSGLERGIIVEQHMAVQQAIYHVAAKLVGPFLLGDPDKGELVFNTPEMPHDVASLTVDLLYPIRRAHYEVAVGIQEESVDVERGNYGIRRVHPTAGEWVVVPRAPLENNVPLGVQLLKNCARNQGGGIAVGHDLAHINLAQVITQLQDVAIG